MNEKFRKWLDGDIDVMENITDAALVGLHRSYIG